MGDQEERCIKSWQKYLSDYEIKRWDESNFDVRCCPYVSEAYDLKKWAFVSDYARFKILYEEGGLYFDTDVELIRPINDIIEAGPYMGIEIDKPTFHSRNQGNNLPTVNTGLGMGGYPGLRIYREILDSYENDSFIQTDGSYSQITVVDRVTKILARHGLKAVSGIQNVADVLIYPAEFFNPKNYWTGKIVTTTNTRSIHHYQASWHDEQALRERELTGRLLNKGFSIRTSILLAKIAMIIRYHQFDRLARIIKRKTSYNYNVGD